MSNDVESLTSSPVDVVTSSSRVESVDSSGARGPKGDKGDPGPAGATGAVGPAGPQGDPGPAGPKGDQGDPGIDGAVGPAGRDGSPGATGAAGPQGDAGPQGVKGDTGDVGPAGAQGPLGPAGVDGATGAAGPKGDKGDRGDVGATGPTGATGPQGATGDVGPTGPVGITGAVGPIGPKGDKGDTGPQGPAGSGTGESLAQAYRGEWSATASYSAGDVITYDGASYVFLEDVAPAGENGPTTPGHTPAEAMPLGGSGSFGPFNDSTYGGYLAPPNSGFQFAAWFRFTAATADPVTFDTIGSDGDTEVVYWSHEPAPSDTRAGFDDDSAGGNAARVTFTPTPGATYYVATARYDTGAHSTRLNWSGLPPLSSGSGAFPVASVGVLASGGGAAGPQGPQGDIGPAGPAGATGAVGPAGPQGVKGDTGATGADGAAGPTGDTGATGAAGPIGPQGVKGDTGATGPQGAAGEQGVKGDSGATGAVGPTGPQGPIGPAGVDGAPGATGADGPAGPKGDTGAQGLVGPQGVQGIQGVQGPTGATGAAGLNWRGGWGAAVAYAVRDAVLYQGSSYRRLNAGTTATPPDQDSTNWQMLAQKGDTGAQGPQGPAGSADAALIAVDVYGDVAGAYVMPFAFAVTPGVYKLDFYGFWSSLNTTTKSYVHALALSNGAALGKGFVTKTYHLGGAATSDTSASTWTSVAVNGSLSLFSVSVSTISTFTQNLEILLTVAATGTLTLNITIPAGMTLNSSSACMLRRISA